MKRLFSLLLLLLLNLTSGNTQTLKTNWTDQVNPANPLPEYPRPQLVRNSWQNLNGQWDYAILPKGTAPEGAFQGKITVPFAVESLLSGVQKTVGPDQELWYERQLTLSLNRTNKRVLLHFGAVDWEAEVWVNGIRAGSHQGGFDGFSIDISDLLIKGEKQTIRVRVWDPSDAGPQPRGKQVQNPKGIWYTPVTGIWQTVWLEAVPIQHITAVTSRTDWENKNLIFTPEIQSNRQDLTVQISVTDTQGFSETKSAKVGEPIQIHVPNPKPWSPGAAFLYPVSIKLYQGKNLLDEAQSYAAFRDIRMAKDVNGHQRMLLNGVEVFHYGPLDQGWWPDGLYTAPTDEALLFDIQKTREMGFNMIRKHVKVEPARWYYHADRLGMLVWQDMPSGDLGNRWEVRPGIIRKGVNRERTAASEKIFTTEWTEIIKEFKFFPSIVVWVPFNEAWGQFKTKEITALTRELDPTRLINSASGGNFELAGNRVVGDILDLHNYPDPVMPDPAVFGTTISLVLGEYGGLGLPLEGHTWQQKDNWGYQSFKSKEELEARYRTLVADLNELIPKGLAAAVYTQTTDVEIETNGLMTYDRKVIKIPAEVLFQIHQKLYSKD
ncbi:MAG: beta-galactosidase [Algoriphagus sp.]|jgi:beta-galactosidase/beta-glucuronidase|uniref:glycoside hydrolase family 2 protein n=1 Tax=Algoriphagus sp. TaxID=1872435 RepID=UPI00274D2AC0|nr:beta-galactosidase [Algoriphagus sp.]MDP4956210.1 beta-galactosidase [Algoriphagus sp.]MDP5125434.1 beta-galactosidase [Algoriphagus sp.]